MSLTAYPVKPTAAVRPNKPTIKVVFVFDPFEDAGAADPATRFILAAFVSVCAPAEDENLHLFFNIAMRMGRYANLRVIAMFELNCRKLQHKEHF